MSRIYGAIHEVVMDERIKVLRTADYAWDSGKVERLLHDLVGTIYQSVKVELLANIATHDAPTPASD
jgi:hypothetical protein